MKARRKALLAIVPIVAALNLAAAQAYRPLSPVQTAGVVLAPHSTDRSEGHLLPASQAALATRALLETVIPPYRDEADLARRFKQACGTPVAPSVQTIHAEHEGEARTFWVLDEPTRTFLQVHATLKFASPHLLMYVQDGVSVNREALAASAAVFETKIYPTLREHFGDLPNEPQITIFNGRIRNLAGYFSSSDLLAKEVNAFSNERPMVFMGIDSVRPGTFTYDSTLAHEVQHLLHHFIHPQQDSWINEGASVLAMSLFGEDQRYRAEAYLNRPETQLNSWSEIIYQTA
ncbi:MAG TPA: hypothetical protein VGW38_23145, partial [Chloroflexota bacterium]|nr:hypothetical protein [Chloroflexota bacterium]